jgi:Protein of unknown function (DUF3306)
MRRLAAAARREQQMGALEKFVSRWSRLKRVADLRSNRGDDAAPPTAAHNGGGGDDAAAKPDDARTLEPAALPSIESITAATDIRAFLQSAVPLELTRAALRRAWVSDPLIRDFIGIAENQWDFTNPTTIPGFGPLRQVVDEGNRVTRTAEALDRSLGQLSAAPRTGPASAEGPTPRSDSRHDTVPVMDKEASVSATANSRSEEIATHNRSRENADPAPPRRAHGGALPR